MLSEPICDETAERSVLGSMMLSPACIPDVMARLRSRDFHVVFHEAVFRTIAAMTDQGKPVDATTVLSNLDTGDLARGGGAPALHDILASTPTAANVQYYVDIVVDKAQRRGMQSVAARIAQLAESSEVDAETALEASRAELEAVVRGDGGLNLFYDDYLAFKPTFGQAPEDMMPTPWSGLTDIIGGFAPGRMYIVAARPSVGKSLVASEIALTVGRSGTVALSSLEMTRRELVMRMTANMCDIPLGALQGLMPWTPTFARRLDLAQDRVKEVKLYIDDRATVTPTMIGSFARTVDRRNGPLRMLILDYLQLMSLGKKSDSRQVEVAQMSRTMKMLSKELDVPVVVLSQLNRKVEERTSRVPTLADLRESGSLEQDADVVMFLSMEMEEDPSTGQDVESSHLTRVTVAKNRHGPTGHLILSREGEYSRLAPPPSLPWTP